MRRAHLVKGAQGRTGKVSGKESKGKVRSRQEDVVADRRQVRFRGSRSRGMVSQGGQANRGMLELEFRARVGVSVVFGVGVGVELG